MMTHTQFIDSIYALLQSNQDQKVGLASPRPFVVHWVDEYAGQRSMVVIARTAADAREIAENATGQFALSVRSL